jgi:Tetratricopeptide repeat
MNVRLFKPFGPAAFALALAIVAGVSPHAEAFPKLLGKKDPVVPSGGSQLADQEARAMQRLTEISPVESSGRWAQAGRAYARLAQDFPFTKTAATAQFRAAQMFEKEAKIGRSFEAYQLLIEKYPQSTEYGRTPAGSLGLAGAPRKT